MVSMDDREQLFQALESLSLCRSNEEDKPGNNYQILTAEEVAGLIDDVSHALSNIETLEITPHIAKYLLEHFAWDVEALEKELAKDRKKVFKKAKLMDPREKTTGIISKVTKSVKQLLISETPNLCSYCSGKDSNQSNYYTSYCKHNFCDRCWFFTLNHHIRHPTNKSYIKCPADKCKIPPDITRYFFLETQVVDFQRSTILNFVENNKYFKWCPNDNCNHLVKVENLNVDKVECECAYTYCFKCNQEWHAPIKCDMLQNWFKLWENHRSKNLNVCNKCHTIVRVQGKCPICLTTSEDNGKKEEECHELSKDDFCRLSFTCICLELQNKREPHDNARNLAINCPDLDGTSIRSKDIAELRKFLKYLFIFVYFVNKNSYVEKFLTYFRKFKSTVYYICDAIPPCYAPNHNNEFKQEIKHKMTEAYNLMEILSSIITEGYNKDWWSLKNNESF